MLVISGGHNYDTTEFELMFKAMPGITPEFALKPDAWELLGVESEYDVLVFYDMYQEISQLNKVKFLNEFDKGTGIVFMHHSSGSHQDWTEYSKLVGGKFYMKKYTEDTSLVLGYTHDININVSVLDRNHPVTEGYGRFRGD